MKIGIAGGGAFGTALAVALALNGRQVTLWARGGDTVDQIVRFRTNSRLPNIEIPPSVEASTEIAPLLTCDTILIAIPAQTLPGFLAEHRDSLSGKALVACCKGIDLTRMTGPATTIQDVVPGATAAMLTGPSFAADIAKGLPTALTLACGDDAQGQVLQKALSTNSLRLYRTTDTVGAELGGALKNVMAIASGIAIGAGFGESARAALITRGFPEMQRLALQLGGEADTLAGLSGFGDLVLTCTSDQSRNYRFGLSLGRNESFDKTTTVEGAATARAVKQLAQTRKIDMPISTVVADLVDGHTDIRTALDTLLSRPLKEE
ncbi:NAD(P)H-dependent glycerol-3-phosphate dehydrogenase [Yoonia litorea]|uniref:Glycerol-3-phosphate dehydrogenase [NAD(P)+] n=1 Tax=Yoonia litorea TaxID=1123755 RepID=A0A1I6MV18_9RHOB|nr:NAD(P)H-dependent glycerol-3-phosphate dehydrogenase [Yoonia litorea]SFS19572.1 glycerol-3-phosphate dehydrogenase (NAD(P)+) [Yoonia litorea]